MSKKPKYEIYENDKQLEIDGPKGVRIWVDYDDVDHDAAWELAERIVQMLKQGATP